MTLIPISMVVPNSLGIYAPSRIRKLKKINYQKFLNCYADNPRRIPVSFEEDCYSNPQDTTAYGFGLDAWYIIG